MAVTDHSPLSWFRGLSLRALGREAEATAFFQDFLASAASRVGQPARIDYFATSLPNLLVFEEDLQQRRDAEHRLLAALANHGLGRFDEAGRLLDQVLSFNRADQRALDLRHELASASSMP
jgi:tetratricopeptide (TPR) repeat protein